MNTMPVEPARVARCAIDLANDAVSGPDAAHCRASWDVVAMRTARPATASTSAPRVPRAKVRARASRAAISLGVSGGLRGGVVLKPSNDIEFSGEKEGAQRLTPSPLQ